MIAQNQGRNRFETQKWACYGFSLCWWGWHETNLNLSAEMIDRDLYHLWQKKGWMTETWFIKRPDLMLDWMGVKVKGVRKEGADYKLKKTDIVIGQWKAGQEMSHFVPIYPNGQVAYDPWWSKEGGSKAVREGSLISYRILPRR